jgi:SAM-dependent methyltransferase
VSQEAEFNKIASNYDALMARALSITGETKEFYARGRISWLMRRLDFLSTKVTNVLDFGCGLGASTPFFFEVLNAQSVVGVDPSSESLRLAREKHQSERVVFKLLDYGVVQASFFDLAFCNGVFHHIPVAERQSAIHYIYKSLNSGGFFAVWENNAWNPLVCFGMAITEFDRDAITLTQRESCSLLEAGGFEILCKDYLFIFPRYLKWLRPLEVHVTSLPIGAQYMILARKPKGS